MQNDELLNCLYQARAVLYNIAAENECDGNCMGDYKTGERCIYCQATDVLADIEKKLNDE